MIIKIPVSTFSKKILLSEHKEPIKLDARSIVYQQFNYPHGSRISNLSKAKNTLNDTLSFRISGSLPKKNPNIFLIGLNLHKFHQEQFIRFIYAQVLIGGQATDAIQHFYDLYGLNDEDYDTEAAYRRWQRFFRKKKIAANIKKNKHAIQLNHSKGGKTIYIPLSDDEVENQLGSFVLENINRFMNSRGKFDFHLLKHFKLYFYHMLGMRSAGDIAADMDIHLKTVYYSLKQAKIICQTDPGFRNSVQKLDIPGI